MKWFFIGFFLFSPAGASNLDSLSQKYESEKSNLLNKEKKKRNVLGELYRINQKMKTINREKAQLSMKLAEIEQRLKILKRKIIYSENKISKQSDLLRKRFQYISKFQDKSMVKLIFSSQSPVELDNNLKILRSITERDFDLLSSFLKNKKMLAQKKQEAEEDQGEVTKIRVKTLKWEKNLASKRRQKKNILTNLQTQKLLHFARIKKMRIENRSLKTREDKKTLQFLDTLLTPLLFEKKGEFALPVEGKIIQKYGYIDHPEFETKLRHKGVFIQVDPEAEVVSIYEGKVSYIGEPQGFGKTIIISHGDNYYSVYCFLSKISVEVGEDIKTGGKIASSGIGHPFLGDGLYFEMRHFSEPLNPLEWIRGYAKAEDEEQTTDKWNL